MELVKTDRTTLNLWFAFILSTLSLLQTSYIATALCAFMNKFLSVDLSESAFRRKSVFSYITVYVYVLILQNCLLRFYERSF